jgi:multicomponent Na+:H+ antiporter subunit C
VIDEIAARFPYWLTTALLVIGLYGMIAKRNLMKKVIGANIFQVAIILFYIAGSQKEGGTVPILEHGGEHIDPSAFINPLPHVLMLTAIVVAVAISGVALAFMIRLYREFHTLDEREILRQVEE